MCECVAGLSLIAVRSPSTSQSPQMEVDDVLLATSFVLFFPDTNTGRESKRGKHCWQMVGRPEYEVKSVSVISAEPDELFPDAPAVDDNDDVVRGERSEEIWSLLLLSISHWTPAVTIVCCTALL